jgi:hypothetical protein
MWRIPDNASKLKVGNMKMPEMKAPEWLKPAAWGVVGGAAAAIIIGFAWGGWVTGGAAGEMEADSAQAAIILAFTPLCVARAEAEPEQLALLEEETSWRRHNFVADAGWVDNVSEQYRTAVARNCASILVEGMQRD